MEQHYKNHRRFVPLYHYVASTLWLIITILSVKYLISSYNGDGDTTIGWILTLTSIMLSLVYYFLRAFALKAQDRAIRAEENLRHFILTGKRINGNLSLGHYVALRFAPDDEFPGLVDRAIKENMKADDIKRSIKNWRADFERA
jgi:hypothetical protein